MFYKGKPGTAAYGLIPSNVLYENKIRPDSRDVRTLPNRDAFQSLLRAAAVNPGPLVIDIESVSLRASPETARDNAETLAKLANWAREAAPGKLIGYYGTNTLCDIAQSNLAAARQLARHVDAFFPSLYTFDDDRSNWEKRAKALLVQSRQLDAEKPVYFYLWPQYHEGTKKALQYVAGEYWKFQLDTAHRYGNGIVLWSRSRDPWDPRSGWWQATLQFAASLRVVKANALYTGSLQHLDACGGAAPTALTLFACQPSQLWTAPFQHCSMVSRYNPADWTLTRRSANFCLRSAWSWPLSASASCVMFMEQNFGPHMEQNFASL
jgi:hypothetical protein